MTMSSPDPDAIFGYTLPDMMWRLTIGLALLAGMAQMGCSGSSDGTCSGTITDDTRSDSPIVINEVKAKSNDDHPDWIELFNTSDSEVDLACWSIIDKSAKHSPYFIPDGARISPGGFVVLHRDKTGRAGFKWGFGSADTAILRDGEGRIADATTWTSGQAAAGKAWGRHPDGTGAFATIGPPTQDASNSAP